MNNMEVKITCILSHLVPLGHLSQVIHFLLILHTFFLLLLKLANMKTLENIVYGVIILKNLGDARLPRFTICHTFSLFHLTSEDEHTRWCFISLSMKNTQDATPHFFATHSISILSSTFSSSSSTNLVHEYQHPLRPLSPLWIIEF